MCGIAGVVEPISKINFTKEEGELFASYNKYRGPDNFQFLFFKDEINSIYLAHHRLSILDLNPLSNQPMVANENYSIIFNGEIFNYKEIRIKLEKLQVIFKTNSDTEVLLQSLIVFGVNKTMSLLKGMFAFAFYDKNENDLYLARDRFGKKPLFYSCFKGRLSFSSDLRSFKHTNIPIEINEEGIGYYLQELTFPSETTILQNVNRVKPGEVLHFKNGILNKADILDVKVNTSPRQTNKNIVDQIEIKLIDAIRLRLNADVPVSSFLSGGIDSGLISAIASQQSEKKLATYTIGFENKKFDERPYAKLVAKKYNTDHHELEVSTKDVSLEELVMEFGEPFADSSMIPSYLVCKAVGSEQKVALSGDGGDELFCGNNTYIQAMRFQKFHDRYGFLGKMTPLLRLLSSRKVKNSLDLINDESCFFAKELNRGMSFSNNEVNQLVKGKVKSTNQFFIETLDKGKESYNSPFKSIYYGAIKTRLLNDYLVKVDKSSMFASIEIRSPFLDDDLVDFVSSLHHSELIQNNISKYLLKKVAKKYLPTEILNKPKSGFSIPIDDWFRAEWKALFEYYVLSNKQTKINLDYDIISSLWNKHQLGENHGNKLFTLLTLHIWLSKFFG